MRSLSLRVRPQVSFGALVAFVVMAESVVLASRAYALHPLPIRMAVIFDLCTVPPLLWWLIVVRRGLARPRTIARVAVLGVVASALVFGREVRLLAVPLELALLYVAFQSVRRALSARGTADAATALRVGLVDAIGDNVAARVVASELTIFWYALFSYGQKPPPGVTAYKRAGWPAIYAALAIASLGEAIGVHFLVRRFGPAATITAAVLHGYALLWLLGDARALKLRPIVVEGDVLRLRLGLRWEADIPLAQIERVETALRPGETGMRLAVLGSPNLRLVLREPAELYGPVGIRRTSKDLLLLVDDPKALAALVQR